MIQAIRDLIVWMTQHDLGIVEITIRCRHPQAADRLIKYDIDLLGSAPEMRGRITIAGIPVKFEALR